MLLFPHDKKLGRNIGSSCKLLVRIISCCPIPPQDQNFRIRCLPLVTSCVLWYSSFSGRLTKLSPMLPCWLEQSNLHHFHFSGRALQETIIPDQSDITLVAGFSTAPDRFWMFCWFSSEQNWSTFQRLLPLPVNPSKLHVPDAGFFRVGRTEGWTNKRTNKPILGVGLKIISSYEEM